MSYERTIAAALAETNSKFALAEALALDLPARPRGGPTGERAVEDHLAEIRQAIIDAGGEPRAVATLNRYRRTGLWVLVDVHQQVFGWVEGFSFSAHDEARASGISFDDFAVKPQTVRQIRSEAKKASPDGNIVKSWTPEQKASAARELLADPEVAEQISEDITDHVAEDPELAEKVVKKRRDAHQSVEPEPEEPKKPARDYSRMIEQGVNLISVALAAEGSGKFTRTDRDGALLYFLAQVIGQPSQPTGDEADFVNEKLEHLFEEVEAYANSEAN